MSLFDPETGKVVDRDALKTVGFRPAGFRKARSKVVDGNKLTEVIHEDDGGTAAINTDKPDGRRAVNAFPRAAAVGAGT